MQRSRWGLPRRGKDHTMPSETREFMIVRIVISIALVAGGLAWSGTSEGDAGAIECQVLRNSVAQAGSILDSPMLNRFLFDAAEKGCTELGEELIDRGASTKARRRGGETALHHAAQAGELDFVRMLLARGSDIEQRDLRGSTPLFLAIERNRGKVVELLLDAGAKPDNPGRSGVAPVAVAAFIGSGRIVDLLLARGVEADAVDLTGKSAIVYAAARGFAGIVKRLLKSGVDVNRRYGNDLTALMWAAGYSNDVTEQEGLETVEALVSAGARLDAVDDRGRTALMTAAELGHVAVVARLIEAGADTGLKDKKGFDALAIAKDEAVRMSLKKP